MNIDYHHLAVEGAKYLLKFAIEGMLIGYFLRNWLGKKILDIAHKEHDKMLRKRRHVLKAHVEENHPIDHKRCMVGDCLQLSSLKVAH